MSTAGNTGPPGRPRGIGFGILLYIVTLGFYSWYWAFKTHDEMKRHTGDGVGGVLGLVIWILLTFVSAFLIPSEVGKLYRTRRPAGAHDGLDGPLALPRGGPDHPRDRLVREGAGSAQPLLGVRAPVDARIEQRGRGRLIRAWRETTLALLEHKRCLARADSTR